MDPLKNFPDPDVVFAVSTDSNPSGYDYSDPNRCCRGDSCDGRHSYSNWRLRTEGGDLSEASLLSSLTKAKKENDSEVDKPPKVAVKGGPTSSNTGGPASINVGGVGVDVATVKGVEASYNSDCGIALDSEDGAYNLDCDEISLDSEDDASQR